MGNQPSAEAHRGTSVSPRLPTDRPLPPLPRPSSADDDPHDDPYDAGAETHARSSHPSAPTSTLTSPYASAPANKLAKPRERARSNATATAAPPQNTDGLAKAAAPGRFSSSSFANLVSTLSSKTPSSSPSSTSTKNTAVLSPSVFTFEEAVAALAGQREPAAWLPQSHIYPTPSLNLEHLQEQQARQLEFEQHQRRNRIQRQRRLSRSKPQKQPQEHQPQEHWVFDLGFNFQFDDQPEIQDLVSDPTPAEREPRKLQRQIQKDKLHRRRFIRSVSSQRTARPQNGFGDLDAGHPRRNSIGSVYSHSAGTHTWDLCSMAHDRGGPMENWPPAAGTRTSWNYDMSSYAAKRLLHIVDGHNDPLDRRHEQTSVASESRQSTISEVTWKSSHPVQDKSPALKRGNSDLSLYAPVRRTSMMNIPGVATRRNSTSNVAKAASTDASPWPSLRHSPSRNASTESLHHHHGPSMPVLKRPTAIIRDADMSVDRVSTPTDHDNIRYSTIGAYKLGSLRITNGTASPSSTSPSASPSASPSSPVEGDTPVRSPDFECKARSLALAALSGDTPAEETGGVPSSSSLDIAKPKTKPSLLSFDVFSPGPPAPEPVKTPAEPPRVALPADLFAAFEFSSFPFEGAVTAKMSPEEQSWARSNTAASTLQTTSKTTAVEDLLFEEDDCDSSTPEYSTTEVLDVRLDPSAKAAVKRGRAGILASRKSIRSVQSVSKSDSGFVSSPASEMSHKPLSKADSGYSSNVSLRSFKQAASKLMAPVAKAATRLSSDRDPIRSPERESFVIDELKLPGPTFDASDISFQLQPASVSSSLPSPGAPPSHASPSPPAREASAPPAPAPTEEQEPPEIPPEIPPKDDHFLTPGSISATSSSTPVVSARPVPRLVRSSTSPAKINNKRYIPPAPINTARPGVGSRSNSQESPWSSRNPHTPSSIRSSSSASALSIGDGTQRPNKFRRFLSFNNSSAVGATHKGPPAVHATHIDDDSAADVPAVPRLVRDKLHEHTRRFPITTKRLALRAQLSSNTLKTIFSVGSLENRGSNADLQGSSLRDGSSRAGSRLSMHRDLATDGTSKRRSRLSMAVDLNNMPEVEVEAKVDKKPEQNHYRSRLAETHVESKVKRGRACWRRQDKEDKEDVQTQTRTSETGHNLGNVPAASSNNNDGTTASRSRSSSLANRTMSMTAQIEQMLSVKLSFSRLSSKFHSPDNNATATAAELSAVPPAPPAPPIPSMAHRKSMTRETETAPKTPVCARMQQIRPSELLRVPPPLRSRSTPPTEAAAPLIKSPADPRWEVKTDHDIGNVPDRCMSELLDRHGSMDSASRTYNGPYVPQRSFLGDAWLSAQCVAAASKEQPQPQSQSQSQSRVIRHRASYDSYSGRDINQLQQQPAWDYHYQRYARPPLAHSRNQSMGTQGSQGFQGSHRGLMPGPQAPYRILHSYNSPAYRGVPIWS